MRPWRKLALVAILVAIAALGVESISSYVIYRNASRLEKSFHPTGSATVALLRLISYKFMGRKVVVWADHGPLFYLDPVLGFAVHPGQYEINEKIDGERHRFQLTINNGGLRATSYSSTQASRHIYISGDSGIFGWGLNDEDTIPWLLQGRLPQYEVVNWSLTRYSTVHALLQLQQVRAQIAPEDVVVLTYHPTDVETNVALPSLFRDFSDGLEAQLAEAQFVAGIDYPFGAFDDQGRFVIRRVKLSCFLRTAVANCGHVDVDKNAAMRVTESAFDEIIALHAGRLLVAIMGGPDSDPVISYLRAKGVPIADIRLPASEPELNDEIATDTHGGPFWNHLMFTRLLSALQSNQLIH
jgi:hypothetical protein